MHTTTKVCAGRFGGLGSAGSERRDRRLDFAGLWKAAGAVLGVHQLAVGNDVEDAARTFDEFGLNLEPLFQIGRQTGGPGVVVSGDAVGNADVHVRLLTPAGVPGGRASPRFQIHALDENRRHSRTGRRPGRHQAERSGVGSRPGATPSHNPPIGGNNPHRA